ncbi:chemotaxis protein CheB [Chromobacterium violaceum]|uniref:protein-glutamate methylesterase n=1 Tax=Chromobacterium violaceum TaxID=536 RepID=A0AAX2MBX9_CHRVL|nr:chemotaxis protein CheB [Chromobacterium violaceum]SUX33689.1 Chemotaxis response regulator protein-glutamate methylesterase [Chromobacterium violaceum]
MPEHFTFTFAERLNKLCPMRVKEAEDGEAALAGVAYIAPGHSHMRVAPAGAAASGSRWIRRRRSTAIDRRWIRCSIPRPGIWVRMR